MLTIANNITARDTKVREIFRNLTRGRSNPEDGPAATLRALAEQCTNTGADVIEINTRRYYDRPEAMEFAVDIVQQATDCQLCLSTSNMETLDSGLKACNYPPVVTCSSIEEPEIQRIMSLTGRYGAEFVLPITEAARILGADEMLKETTMLASMANEQGIPNEKLFVDIGLLYLISEVGQRYFLDAMEFLRALSGAFDPPVRSTCWIGNASAGAPRRLRRSIDNTCLAMLAGLGLSSAFVDALDRDTMRTIRLVRIFRNEVIYSNGEIKQ